ncbi:MAG TPA: hypothetical protein VH333_02050 [Pseudonocardiaceae bacterium]|jgi:hypothetical protein|nr:hypothetical protein [Pseudonocardiaceae bacterium]
MQHPPLGSKSLPAVRAASAEIVRAALNDAYATAIGSRRRDDPITTPSGGPAGNARLTAWTGLLLLVVSLAECATLVSVRGLITVHILIGAFLLPLVMLKTLTTGWRITRYYLGSAAYRQAGPPPLLLRILGPLVVLSGLAVLGTGLALIALGPATFTPIITLAGYRVDALTLHQGAFIVWLAATGLHVLVRTVPALQLATGSRQHRAVAGARRRASVLLGTVLIGVAVSVLVLQLSGHWTHGGGAFHRHDSGSSQTR